MPTRKKLVDGRTRWAKRKKAHLESILGQVGRELDQHEIVMASNAAAMLTQLDQLKLAIEKGNADPRIADQVVRLNNALARILSNLGIGRKATPGRAPGRMVRKSAPPPGHVPMRDRMMGTKGNGVLP
jgi:hypothetical protein